MPRLDMKTPVQTPPHEAVFVCSECGREFRYVRAFGGNSIRGAVSYMITRFNKHVARHHPQARP